MPGCACCGRRPARPFLLTCTECDGHEDAWHPECLTAVQALQEERRGWMIRMWRRS